MAEKPVTRPVRGNKTSTRDESLQDKIDQNQPNKGPKTGKSDTSPNKSSASTLAQNLSQSLHNLNFDVDTDMQFGSQGVNNFNTQNTVTNISKYLNTIFLILFIFLTCSVIFNSLFITNIKINQLEYQDDLSLYVSIPRYVKIKSNLTLEASVIIKDRLGTSYLLKIYLHHTKFIAGMCINIRYESIEVSADSRAVVFECYEDSDWEDTLFNLNASEDFTYSKDPLFKPKSTTLSQDLIFTFIKGITVENYRVIAEELIDHISKYIARMLKLQRRQPPEVADANRIKNAIERTSHHHAKQGNPSLAICFNRNDMELIQIIFEMPVRVTLPGSPNCKELVLSNEERLAQAKQGIKERKTYQIVYNYEDEDISNQYINRILGGVLMFMKAFGLRYSEDIRHWFKTENPLMITHHYLWQIRLLYNKNGVSTGCAIIMFSSVELANKHKDKYPKIDDGKSQKIFFEDHVCTKQNSKQRKKIILETNFNRSLIQQAIRSKTIYCRKFDHFGTIYLKIHDRDSQIPKPKQEIINLIDCIKLFQILRSKLRKLLKSKSKVRSNFSKFYQVFKLLYKKIFPTKYSLSSHSSILSNQNNQHAIKIIGLIILISNLPCVNANLIEFKIMSINVGRALNYCASEIEEIWDTHKPDVLFIQELRNSYEDLKKFSKNGKFFDKRKIREDIYFDFTAKNNNEIIRKKLKKNENKVNNMYDNDENRQNAFKEINRATNLKNNTSCAIMHNQKIQNIKIKTVEDSKMKRFLVLATETENDVILFFNIYSPPKADERETFTIHLQNEIERIKSEFESATKNKNIEIILGGDFNANNNPLERQSGNNNYQADKVYSEFLRNNNLHDIFRDKNKDIIKYTFERGENTKSKIDHWLTTKPFFTNFDSEIHDVDKDLSDCHALIELRFKIESDKVNRENVIEKIKYETDTTKLKVLLNNFKFSDQVNFNRNAESTNDEIDRTLGKIIEELTAVLDLDMKANRKENGTRKNDYKLDLYDTLKKRVKFLYATYFQNDETHNQNELKIIVKKTKIIINNDFEMKKRISDVGDQIRNLKRNRLYKLNRNKTNKMIKIATNENTKLSLKEVARKFKNSQQIIEKKTISYVKDGENIMQGTENILKSFEKFWIKIFTKQETKSYSGKIEKLDIPDTNLIELDEEAFVKIINNLKDGKSPGPDRLTNEVFKAINKEEIKKIYEVYKIIWETEYIPKSWKSSIITLINKGNDLNDVSDYRPIALQNVIMKIFAKIIKTNFTEILEEHKLINSKQFGFRNEKGTTQAIQTMLATIEDAKQHKNEIHVCLVDFSKAFDSVDWDFMFENMQRRGYSAKLINILRNYLKGREVLIKTPVGFTKLVSVTRGTPQGDPFSSILFIIFIDVLIHCIDESKCGYVFKKNQDIHIPQLTFADDLGAVSNSNEKLQKILDIISVFSSEGSFPINSKKTVYTHNRNKNFSLNLNYKGNMSVIEGEKNIDFKYLGVTMNLELNFKKQQEICIEKLNNTLHLIGYKQFNTENKVKIINCIIIPKITYPMKFVKFNDETVEEMDKIVAAKISRASNMQYNIRKEAIQIELGIKSIGKIHEKLFLNSCIFAGLNFPDEFPKNTLLQRLKDKNYKDYNSIHEAEKILAKYNMNIQLCNQKKIFKINMNPKEYNENIHSVNYIDKMNIEWVVAATDGSAKDGNAASAFTYNENPNNVRTVNPLNDHSYYSELLALLITISEAPINKNILIMTDCLSTIEMINRKKWTKKDIATSFEYQIAVLAKKFIDQRENNYNQKISIQWIPSHLDELIDDQEKSERKALRVSEMEKIFGTELVERMIIMNELCDRYSKSTRTNPNYDYIKNNEYSSTITVNDNLGKPLTKKDMMKIINNANNTEIQNKYFENKEVIQKYEPILTILSTPPELKKISCQTHNGQLKTGNYINSRLKINQKRTYHDMTKTIINPTEYCEDEKCIELFGARLDTAEHLFEFCGNNEITEIRSKKRQRIKQIINETSDKNGNIIHEKDKLNIVIIPEINEPNIKFLPALRIIVQDNIIIREMKSKKGMKISNTFSIQEKDKLKILKDLGIGSEENEIKRGEYIKKVETEDDNSRNYMTTEFKNESRCWISKGEWQEITTNNIKKENQLSLAKCLISTKLNAAKEISEIYYKNKFDKRRREGVNINKLLYPLAFKLTEEQTNQ